MKLKGLHYGIIFLVLFTAAMHLGAAFDRQLFSTGPDPLFTLNGLGYLGLLGAYFLPIPFFQKITIWCGGHSLSTVSLRSSPGSSSGSASTSSSEISLSLPTIRFTAFQPRLLRSSCWSYSGGTALPRVRKGGKTWL